MTSKATSCPQRPSWARSPNAFDRRHFLRGLAGAAAAAALLRPAVVRAAEVEPTQTAWSVADLPEIDAMAARARQTFTDTSLTFELDGRQVSGNAAGRLYRPIFVRDLATVQPALAFFLPEAFMRSSVEAFLLSQRFFEADAATAGAVSAVLDAGGRFDKATAVSDEESSLVQAAHAYYEAFGGAAWLATDLAGRTVLERLGDALDYLRRARRWAETELLFRGHTTDWGDVKRAAGPEPTDLADGDELTLSPFDQAWYFRALNNLADMSEAAGRPVEAEARQSLAATVRAQALETLWQPERGHFLVHKHVTDWTDPFDEAAMVTVSDALAIYAGLALPEQVAPALEALSMAATRAGTDRAGLTLFPPFPSDFFQSRRMLAGEYQNGAVWDWWGGLQIVSEFEHGQAARALNHLAAAARSWESADGVFEWFHIPSATSQGSPDFTGAAGTLAQGVIRGLFGVRLRTDGFSFTPRLGARSGWLHAVRPGGGELRVAQTAFPSLLFVDYQADERLQGSAAVLLPDGWQRAIAFLDGRPIDTVEWAAGADRYAGGWTVPGGTHSLIVARVA